MNYASFSEEMLSQNNRLKGNYILINATIQHLKMTVVLILAAKYVAHVLVRLLVKWSLTENTIPEKR
jgi:hypothetical protein